LGVIYKKTGNLNKSKKYYKLSLENFESINKDKLVAKLSNNLGSIYKELGEAENAMLFYTKSLRTREKLNDKKGMAFCYLNIGVFYNTVNNLLHSRF
jgi:tetratricopeptide (TPR) repeat protein